jgi:hypothetical protein
MVIYQWNFQSNPLGALILLFQFPASIYVTIFRPERAAHKKITGHFLLLKP